MGTGFAKASPSQLRKANRTDSKISTMSEVVCHKWERLGWDTTVHILHKLAPSADWRDVLGSVIQGTIRTVNPFMHADRVGKTPTKARVVIAIINSLSGKIKRRKHKWRLQISKTDMSMAPWMETMTADGYCDPLRTYSSDCWTISTAEAGTDPEVVRFGVRALHVITHPESSLPFLYGLEPLAHSDYTQISKMFSFSESVSEKTHQHRVDNLCDSQLEIRIIAVAEKESLPPVEPQFWRLGLAVSSLRNTYSEGS
ncbi:hypothetical protein JB92DRAFT_2829619 [Gautieria morchelliformis]|nr:hypothetical protein JB92DRAFT_2829619 [Gautieria morchelliformis]